MKPFKNKKEELQWEKENRLTVGKLIEHLSKFPKDSLVYVLESNTNTWQASYRGTDIMSPISYVRKCLRKRLSGWFKGSKNKSQNINREIRETFRYALDKEGVCVYI